MIVSILLTSFFLFCNGDLFVKKNYDEAKCKEIGFDVQSLKCYTCKLLPKYNLDLLLTDCLQCCTEEKKETYEKYPYAEIEICDCNLHRFPQVAAFVRSKMKDQWGIRLRIRHVRGTLPTIKLQNNNNQVQKSLNIEKWDTETITDFLNDWLE